MTDWSVIYSAVLGAVNEPAVRHRPCSVDNRTVSVDHYENFPVASWLCPPPLRPAVAAIYWFARTADDLADEGDAEPAQRLADLAAYRRDLLATAAGKSASGRWTHVFEPLARAIDEHRLPIPLLDALLSAFEQDVVKHRYADRAELLDYCARSANPVGRLLLHLYGIGDAVSLQQSDAICTALQLANFWQDFGVDAARDRLYAPASDIERHAVDPAALLARRDSPAARRLVADLVAWATRLMHEGAPLATTVRGRAGWELRLVVQGGLRILEKIARLDHATLVRRPALRWPDGPPMLWRALWMRHGGASLASEPT